MRRLLLVVLAIGAVATACTGDDDDDDDGGTPATISGVVRSNDTPLVGATVEEVGASNEVLSVTSGAFTITVEADEEVFLRVSGAGLYPLQRGFVAPAAGLTGVDIGGPMAAEVAGIEGGLGITLDDAKGIFAVDLDGSVVGTAGGISATISATAGGSFVFNSNGNPVLSSTTLPDGDPVIVFYNVDVGATTVSVTGATCSDPHGITSYRVDAATIMQADLDCN